jgi:hypothetical protein
MAHIGLFVQIGIIIAFFCVLFGTNLIRKTGSVVIGFIISGAISLVFGIISLLFRKEAHYWEDLEDKDLPLLIYGILLLLPSGARLLVLMDIVVTITMAEWFSYNFFAGLGIFLGIAVSAIPGVMIMRKVEESAPLF